MTPSAELTAARRQALIDLADSAGYAGRLRLLDAASNLLVSIPLAYPCGVVDETGAALGLTEYGQVVMSGDVASARLESGSGVLVASTTVGLATDQPPPELPLPALRLFAGAFYRLSGAHIACD